MPATLYQMPPSGPVRAVRMTASLLGEELELKMLDLTKGEHLSEDFLKINPQHCIPTLVEEDGFTLWESRAISAYLCNKQRETNPKAEELYPSAPRDRARVDRILHWDLGLLGKANGEFIYPRFKGQDPTEEGVETYRKAVEMLNTFLEGQDWTTGLSNLTIADLAVYASLGYGQLGDYDFSVHPNVVRWQAEVAAALGEEADKEINQVPLEFIGNWLKERKAETAKAE